MKTKFFPRIEPLEARIAPATLTWDGSDSSDWFDADNWTPTGVPGAGDIAILAINSTINLTANADVGAFQESSGTFTGLGNLTILGNLTWSGGAMSGTGTTSVAGTGSTISGAATKTLSRTLINTGTMTFSSPDTQGGISFSGSTPGVLNNGGTFNVTAGGEFLLGTPAATGQSINNSGTWNVSGAGISNVGLFFINSGSVNVNSGTFDLGLGSGAGNTTGDFNVASGATLRLGGGNFSLAASADIAGAGAMVFEAGGTTTIGGTYNVTGTSTFSGGTVNFTAPVTSLGSALTVSGATVNFNAPIPATVGTLVISNGTANFNSNDLSVSAITLSGGVLGGSASISTAGNLTWSGGAMSGTGTTSVAGTGSTISGAATKTLSRTLINTGTMTFSNPDTQGGISFSGSTPGVLNNGGTFNVTAGGEFLLGTPAATGQSINNSGTWNVSGAGISNVGLFFINSGSVNVNSGTFDLGLGNGAGNTTGDFNVASGATLRLDSGFSLAATADIAGAGNVSFGGGTTSIGGTYNVTGTSTFSGGTVNFTAPVTSLGSALTVNGGTANFNAAIPAVLNGALTISSGAANFNSNDLSVSAITLSGGVLGGSASISTAGNLTWSGGAMSGTGTTSVAGSGSTISSAATKTLSRTLINTGTMTFSSPDTQGGISFSGSTPGVLNNGGTFNVTAGGEFLLGTPAATGQSINNSGTWNVSGAGISNVGLFFINSGSVNVNSGTFDLGLGNGAGNTTGDFNVASGATLRLGGGNFSLAASADIAGAGAMVFEAGGTTTIGGTYNVTGTSTFSGGTVNFTAPVTSLGSALTVSGATVNFNAPIPATVGTLVISNGTANFNSNDLSVSAITLSGGVLGGSASISTAGNLTWSGGTMSGTGTTSVAGTGSTISGTGIKTLNRTLSNTGTITCSSPDSGGAPFTGEISFGGSTPGVLNNSGTFNVTAGGEFSRGGGAGQSINNSGTWNVSGAGTTSNVGLIFNNSGSLNVNSGTFDLGLGSGAGNTTGDFNVASGATLRLGGGNFSLAASADIAGAGAMVFEAGGTTTIGGTYNVTGTSTFSGGTVNFTAPVTSLGSALTVSGATVNFNIAVTAGAISLSSGTLGGTGAVSASGLLTWTGGTMSGSGVTNANGGLLMNGSGAALNGRTLNLPAGQTATMTGTSAAITFSNGARFNNAGTYLAQSDVTNDFVSGGGATSLFNNSGTFTRDTRAGDFSVAVPVANTGTINLLTSTLVLSAGFTQADSGKILGGRMLNLTGGTVSAGGAITANVSNSGAVLSPGESGAGNLVINGNYVQTAAATLRVDVGGVVAGQFDTLSISGTAAFAGTLNVALLGGFVVPTGQQYNVLTYGPRTGNFTLTGAPGFSQSYQATDLVLTRAGISYAWDAGGGIDTSWFNRLNWGPDGIPTAGDSTTLSSSATITLPSAAVVGSFTQSAGFVTGAGTLTTDSFSWSGGTQSGAGSTAVATGGSFNISGAGQKILTERTLNQGGVGVWTGTGNLQLANGAIFNNSGSFDIQNSARLEVLAGGTEPRLANSGTLQKMSTGTTTFNDVSFENSGTLRLSSGTLSITGATASFTQSGGATTLSGGSLSAVPMLTFNGGALSGVGTISGSVFNAGATLQPGGTDAAGTIAISGTYTQGSGGTLAVEIGGVTAGTEHDQLSVGNIATLGGTLGAALINGFTPGESDGFNVIGAATRSGTFSTLNATGPLALTYTATQARIVSAAAPPSLSINDMSVAEGASGTVLASFMISLSAPSSQPVTVQYATGDGTATAPEDYAAAALTTVTFAPGEVTKTVSINVNGDLAGEPDETFLVNLSNPTNATLLDPVGQGTILNDDAPPLPSLSINDVSVAEGASGTVAASFTISLSAPSSQPVTVQYLTTDGAATAPEDYAATALTTVTFAPGEITKTVSVNVNGDLAVESEETFLVNLSNPTNGTLLDPIGQGTILNDDAPPLPSLSINDVNVAESASGTVAASFTISLSAPSSQPVTVQYTTGDGTATAPEDYAAAALTTVTFAPGEVTKTVSINVNGDLAGEPDETFLVNLSNPSNATITDSEGQGTILNDDAPPLPSLSINDVSVAEGASGTVLASFSISLSAPSSQPVTVQYATGDGTATAPEDYAAVALTTVTFAPGETIKMVSVAVSGDSLVEPDELFAVNLSNPTNATLLDPIGQGTILNDDAPPLPSLSINDVSVAEGASGTVLASFSISLSAPSSQPVTVQYATGDGTATAPEDYAAAALTTVTFAPGEVTKTVSVNVNGDLAVEPDETFLVNLSSATNATILDAQGQGTIQNDDTPSIPALSIDDVRVIEKTAGGSVTASFTVSLSEPSSQTVTVQYATANGTATAPEDYTAATLTTLSFNPGEISKTVVVTVTGDDTREPDETFFVNLSNPANATLADSQGLGTIAELAIAPKADSLTFTDVDGDKVTVEASKGSFSALNFVFAPNGTLQLIDLKPEGNEFSGADLQIRVKQVAGGDGLVNVGAINATGINLGEVNIRGDVGQIDVGDGLGKAMKSLTVGSLGTQGVATQTAGTLNPLLSEIRGSLPKLTVQRDVKDAIVEVSDKLGKVLIGGSLIDSGAPLPRGLAAGSIGVFLNGGIPPVSASRAGTIFAPNIGPVTVVGDINGGEITADAEIKSVRIVGRLMSLNPLDPAVLRAGTAIDKIVINDDVQNALILAGYNRKLEPLNPNASIGKVVVNGDWTASSVVAGVADPTDNGFGIGDELVAVLSRIASVIIKGTATGSATPTDHSAITAHTIGTLRIAGAKLPLTSGSNNILLDPLNQNFRAVEI